MVKINGLGPGVKSVGLGTSFYKHLFESIKIVNNLCYTPGCFLPHPGFLLPQQTRAKILCNNQQILKMRRDLFLLTAGVTQQFWRRMQYETDALCAHLMTKVFNLSPEKKFFICI